MTFESDAAAIGRVADQVPDLEAAIQVLQGQLAEISEQIVARDVIIADLRRQIAELTRVPEGFVDVTTLGDDWAAGLRNVPEGMGAWFPEGEWFVDAWWIAQRIIAEIPKHVTRFRGAGSGKTILTVRPRTSRWSTADFAGMATNPLSVLQQTGGKLKEFGGFTLVVGDQGHDHHGISLFNAAPGVQVDDVEMFGGEGSGGAPPKEVFQFTMRGSGHHRLNNLRLHGQDKATVGITLQNTVDTWVTNSVLTGHRASAFVAYQTFDSGTENLDVLLPTVRSVRVNTAAINAERCGNIEHRGISILGGVYQYNTHFSWSNDLTDGQHFTLDFEGRTYSTENATFSVVDPRSWSDWWNYRKTGKTETFTKDTLGTDAWTAIIGDTWATNTLRADGTRFWKYGPKATSIETVMQSPFVLIDGQSVRYDWNFGGKHFKIRAPYRAPAAA